MRTEKFLTATAALMSTLGSLVTLAAQTPQFRLTQSVPILSGQPSHIIVRQEGTIVVFGQFVGNEGEPFSNLVLLDSNGRVLKRLPPLLYPREAGSYDFHGSKYDRCDAALADGSFIVGTILGITMGTFGEVASRPIHLNSDGTRDALFESRFGTNAPFYQAAVQSDGKLLFAGQFGGVPIRRALQDGTPDTEFNHKVAMAGLPPIGDLVSVAPDSKILLWPGEYVSNESIPGLLGFSLRQLVRLNSDGSLDRGFVAPVLTNSWLVGVQPDGKLLVRYEGGRVRQFGESKTLLSRLNQDGSLDTGFKVDADLLTDLTEEDLYYTYFGPCSIVADGNIAIGLNTSRLNIRTHKSNSRIKRLLPDGRLDPTFNDQLHAEWIVELVPLSSGKLLVLYGEEFIAQHLVRLNEDGSVDATFDSSRLEERYIRGVKVAVSGGRRGFRYIFQTSSNLRDWMTLDKLGPIQFDPSELSLGWLDADAGRFRQRFYRVIETLP